jgi:hypothetical protein
MLKKPFLFSHNNLLHNELDKRSVSANKNEPQAVNGPVVVKLTTSRFTGTVSKENRSYLAAYLCTQYVPPLDSVPHPGNCTFAHRQSGIETIEVRERGQDDWAYIEHCLQLCVYRHGRFVSPCVTN